LSASATPVLLLLLPSLLHLPPPAGADCWLIEGDKGYVWLAICSQNQPPYETIPQHINNTVHDLRLNENKLKAVFFSSLSRFTNLTDLNLTKNEISYIEDGAFAGQSNLQVLQLGYNKLTNLTEGMLRGLGRMQCLFVQHNLIEVISTNAFWECPSLTSLDLSSNKLARLDPATFTGLSRLMVCELAGNPFHCGCDLYSFLTWLEAFNNVTHTYDRLQCETPRDFFGYPLLSPLPGHGRNARTMLASACRDGVMSKISTTTPDFEGSGSSYITERTFQVFTTPPSSSSPNLTLKVQQVSLSSASLLVHIPKPYSKMYILVQYNNSYVSDVMNLKKAKEIITLNKLKAHTNYTFCVASIRNQQRFNHTCVFFSTRLPSPDDMRPSPSTTTHYIMTILGCLFGMVIVLGLVYYCLRKRRMQEEKQKSISVKKTILEMRYGPEAVIPASSSASSGMHQGSGNTCSSRLSAIPQAEKMASAFSEAMAATKGNYMDVRTSGSAREDEGTDPGEDSEEDGQGSASEISTIAKEVDKVNQIINNCIDALKLDSVAVAAAAAAAAAAASGPPGATSPPPQLPPCSSSSSTRGGGGFLSPPYRDPPPASSSSRPLQRQLSADAAVVVLGSVKKRCSVSSSGSIKSARVFSLDVPEPRSPDSCKYTEKGSPLGCGEPLEKLPLVGGSGGGGGSSGAGIQQHLEVGPAYHCSEHRHSFPALYYEGSSDSPSSQKASFLKPLTRSKRDAASYSQLSPRHHYSGYSSSPEYSSESTLKIWERFRPYRKSPREEASYVAAGHALRKKVQFAKDEDLHDILDYWKGVSAQQKL
uniref:Extracellular leucine rich repeat and fibronectin type III domain containing 2 n=1 Tax=Lepisosteus oculatus TaxID=7918 RepID=W5MZP4_LEPOC